MSSPPLPTDPDWSTGVHDLFCPMCKYDLFGLAQPCCPECGYTFNWQQLRNALLTHPFLFELHPERNRYSFFKTLIQQFRQIRFWTKLQPMQKLNPQRLMLYWLLICSLFFLIPVSVAINVSVQHWVHMSQVRADVNFQLTRAGARRFNIPASPTPAQIQKYLDDNCPAPTLSVTAGEGLLALVHFRMPIDGTFAYCALLWLWPFATYGITQLFKISILKSGVDHAHFLRVLIYCADHLVWFYVVVIVSMFTSDIRWTTTYGNNYNYFNGSGSYTYTMDLADHPTLLMQLSTLWLLIYFIRIAIAKTKYLRVRQALMMIVLSQIILVLFVANISLSYLSTYPLKALWPF